MAPVSRTASAKKGKARIYLCGSCYVRHAPPTGAACPRAVAPSKTRTAARPGATATTRTRVPVRTSTVSA